ncbi:glycosyltransferase 87 family protein [Streptomyces sp. WMMB 322]|uniref:glycosyltransferase 87 family protein n=1 Tax=Streptomyces sp. WMMB 322 TaxID=1286821 RepID=UPI00099EA25C|nr:glycosyltransferase 87 family protein [Streptomyces sp. WMMB 322]
MLLVSLAALAALFAVRRFPVADLLVYRAEGAAVVNGGDLYGFTVTAWDLPATYPPFAALLFVPTVWLSPAVAKAAFVAGNAALAVLLVHLSLRLADGLPGGGGTGLRAGRWSRRAVVLAATAAALWLEPVFQTLVFGQINLLLVCLVLWDLGRPDGARGKGLAVGIATGIKLTPAVFAVHLLLTGRVRAGLTALGGFAGTVAAGALVLPSASWEFFTHRVFETARVGKVWIVDNQSLQGLIARVAHTSEPGVLWLVPAAVVAVAGLVLARRLHVRHGQDAWAVMAAAFTALLVSPISWSHHWVWCVPLLALLAAGRARPGAGHAAAAAVAAVFAARTLWLVPKHGAADLRLEWWLQPFASPYALLTLGLLAAAAVRCYSPSLSGAASGWAVSRSWESTMR